MDCRNGRNRHNKLDHQTEMDATMLPQLQNSNIKLKNFNSMMFESLCYRSRGHRNYYRDESNRKYRGNISQKDRRDSDHNHHHNRRDYKDRSSKNQQKELADSAEGSSEADNSASGKS